MKVKILKKGRKKYSYYFNKSGNVILINHQLKRAAEINEEFLETYYKMTPEEVINVACGLEEFKWRTLKTIMYGKYGWSMVNLNYKHASLRHSKLQSLGVIRKTKKKLWT